MNESQVLLSNIQSTLDDFCAAQKAEFSHISPDLEPIIDYSSALMAGGKRFRALFCYFAWSGALAGAEFKQDQAQLETSRASIIGITAALEMFHAAALVHDDLLDQSATRRGAPAVHKKFEALHKSTQWAGSSERFGAAGAILTGDLLLSWASELFGKAIQAAPNYKIQLACRDEFSKMRTEVMAGQYLDVLEENAAHTRDLSEAVGRANRVMLYKTAKYSIEAPLLIGAAFAGASDSTLRSLSAFGIPLGMAFQLRDDVLGVFGDPEITGKPAGDDLREGKRTVLVGLTKETLNTSANSVFEELLCSRELSNEQIRFMQQTIVDSGALEKAERMIDDLAAQSLDALEALEFESSAKEMLGKLALKVIKRDA